MMSKDSMYGTLYLIPSLLGDTSVTDVLPERLLGQLPLIDCYVVEEIRTARRFLSRAGLKGRIDTLEFHELNEHTSKEDIERMSELLRSGRDVGLISEAGLPAVADPGRDLVAAAHRKGIRVVPFAGPSSLMMALMSSGLNGQSFAFCGYLPAKTEDRKNAIRTVERTSMEKDQTQIMIETPYRNDSFFHDLVNCCQASTRICYAADLTLPTETIMTRTAGEWRKSEVSIGKRPCVFLILASR